MSPKRLEFLAALPEGWICFETDIPQSPEDVARWLCEDIVTYGPEVVEILWPRSQECAIAYSDAIMAASEWLNARQRGCYIQLTSARDRMAAAFNKYHHARLDYDNRAR